MNQQPHQSPAAHADLRFPESRSSPGGSHTPAPITAADHYLGDLGAPLRLIEYGDYECPFCAMAQPGVRELVARFGRDIAFAFRHFPLVSQHPHAWAAALAAEAAGRQGKFWEMHNHLLSQQHRLMRDDLLAHARSLGLDEKTFDRDLADNDLAEHVRHDALGAVQSLVRGTPTFFVNGRRLEGGYREAEIEAALRSARESG